MFKKISMVLAILGFFISAPYATSEVLTDGRNLDVSSRMGQYLFSQTVFKGLYDATIVNDKILGLVCADRYMINPVNLVVVDPINFPENAKHPVSGRWQYRFDAVRCGKTKRYNLLVSADPGGNLRPHLLPPGNSVASFQLILDVVGPVKNTSLVVLGESCKDFAFFDTEIVESKGQDFSHPWKERWTSQGCGKQAAVLIEFIPTQIGTTFNISEATLL